LRCSFRLAASLLAGTGFAAGGGASAQDTGVAAPPPEAPTSAGARVFEPAYFAQYAPRNALDMVERIPGFSIVGGDDNGQRGLGQANQNVIVNGERFSSKSDGLREQLRRIPASDVVRIELVDGNTLDIPGLSGLVANVISRSTGAKGQFRYAAGFRAHNTQAQLYGGEASMSGQQGTLEYTVSLSNPNDRFGADGPTIITDGNGNLIESQYTKFSGKSDNPKLATNLTWRPGGDTIGHLNLSYGTEFFSRIDPEIATPVTGPVRVRDSRSFEDGPQYEIGGDVEFKLGPGKLKLIALERFNRTNFDATLVDAFSDGSPSDGFRFQQTNGAGERIGRAEYRWNMFKADWQLSAEAAFNRLDRSSALFTLSPAGDFIAIPFPSGNGGVTEDRYETSLSMSRALSPTISVQAIGTVEFSTLQQTGSAANSRSFMRPKGSLVTTWKPSKDFDATLTLARRVSQLSFGDFLASVSLNDNTANGGNNQLVPYQSWNAELTLNKALGPWGSIKFEARKAWFEDFIDFFPLADGGEARGNIGNADRLHLETNATVKFDPLGFNGARLDIQAIKRWMHERDPFTGETRPFSYDQEGLLSIDFRHDIPSSRWAWGANLFHNDSAPYARRFEEGHEWEGPFFGGVFVENKNVLGLTVRVQADNLTNARNRVSRTVFAASRPDGAVLFTENTNRRIGPIFRLQVSGNF
jgi:hypothetical protein